MLSAQLRLCQSVLQSENKAGSSAERRAAAAELLKAATAQLPHAPKLLLFQAAAADDVATVEWLLHDQNVPADSQNQVGFSDLVVCGAARPVHRTGRLHCISCMFGTPVR